MAVCRGGRCVGHILHLIHRSEKVFYVNGKRVVDLVYHKGRGRLFNRYKVYKLFFEDGTAKWVDPNHLISDSFVVLEVPEWRRGRREIFMDKRAFAIYERGA